MPHYPSNLQLCSAKAQTYGSLFKEKIPSFLKQNFLFEACGIKLDISRQHITVDQLAEMRGCAKESNVFEKQNAMVTGKVVNFSEERSALHTLLRDPTSTLELTAEVQWTFQQMKKFAIAIRNKKIVSSKGIPFTDVINVGIGGSYTGPRLVCEACYAKNNKNLKLHWVSNVDGWVLSELLPRLNPESTLVIVSSKSFGTAETLLNAKTIKEWFLGNGVSELDNHFVLCTANPEAPTIIGIPNALVFKFWDWVGGRFSVWSSVGLPVLLAVGPERFEDLLIGAHDMDQHALQTEANRNLPLTLALLAIWDSTAIRTTSYCVLPYEHRLSLLVNWLQQLEMESLGKSRLVDGSLTKYPTCTPVWGGLGNDAQHAFFQCLRQGTNRTAIDIITADTTSGHQSDLHRFLLANAKAQANVLVTEDPNSEAVNCLNVIHLSNVTPYHIGALMALYEHKTTMLGFLLGLNPFDQPGVELGKKLAQELWNKEKKV